MALISYARICTVHGGFHTFLLSMSIHLRLASQSFLDIFTINETFLLHPAIVLSGSGLTENNIPVLQPPNAPREKKWIVPVIIISIILVLAAMIALSSLVTNLEEEINSEVDLSNITISYTPENPQYGDSITITVEADDGIGCIFDVYKIQDDSYNLVRIEDAEFNETEDNVYQTTIGPYSTDTAIWFVVEASSRNDYVCLMDNFITIDEHGTFGSNTLNVTGVRYALQYDQVTIEADVELDGTLDLIEGDGMVVEDYRSYGTSYSLSMYLEKPPGFGNGTSHGFLWLMDPDEEPTEWYAYMIIAVSDYDGHIAYSEPVLIDLNGLFYGD